jgi:hypothetical protein
MVKQATVSAHKRPQAQALHIGINEVSAAHYAGWTGPLAACEFDAHDMAVISKSQGMKSTLLITKKATRASVLTAIRKAAKSLAAGDLFFMSFSGHGGQVPDVSGEEPDKLDETWCLFDGQLIDDELYYELSRFKAGVRILVLSDSCHSGTVVRAARPAPGTPQQRPRIMPRAVGLRVYSEHKAFYDKLQNDVARAAGGQVQDPDTALANVAVSNRLTAIVKDFHPAVILISGCQDNQFSMDGNDNGAFTEQLLSVWNNGSFQGSYASFHARIRAGLPPTQSPNLFTLGPAAKFLKQAPFSV